jgi:uncharacterized protein
LYTLGIDMWHKTKTFFKNIYRKLVRTDASPHKIALGFSLGVFIGIYPGTGPLIALALAYIFGLPKGPAFLGGILTNSWLSFVTLVLAAKIGAVLLNLQWAEVEGPITSFFNDFHWRKIIDGSMWETIKPILKPLLIGYAVVGLVAGIISYFIVLYLLKKRAKKAIS